MGKYVDHTCVLLFVLGNSATRESYGGELDISRHDDYCSDKMRLCLTPLLIDLFFGGCFMV